MMDSFRQAAAAAAASNNNIADRKATTADGSTTKPAATASAHAGFLRPMKAFAAKEATGKATYRPSVMQPQRRTFAAAAAYRQRQQQQQQSVAERTDRRPSTAGEALISHSHVGFGKLTAPTAGGRLVQTAQQPTSHHLPPLSATIPPAITAGAVVRTLVMTEKTGAMQAWAAIARKDAAEHAWPHGVVPSLTGYWAVSLVRRHGAAHAGSLRGQEEEVIGIAKVCCPQPKEVAPRAGGGGGVLAARGGGGGSTAVVGVTPSTRHLALVDAQQQQPQLAHEGKLSVLAAPGTIGRKAAAANTTTTTTIATGSPAWAVTATSNNRSTIAKNGPSYTEVMATIKAEVDRLGLDLSHVMYLDEEFDNTFALLTPKTMAFCHHGIFRAVVTEKPDEDAEKAVAAAKEKLTGDRQQQQQQQANATSAALQQDITTALRQLEEGFERNHAAVGVVDGDACYETVMQLLHPTTPDQPSARALALVGDETAATAPDVFLSRLAEAQAQPANREAFTTRTDIKHQATEPFREHLRRVRQLLARETVVRDAVVQQERLAAIFLTQFERADREATAVATQRAALATAQQQFELAQQQRVCALISEVHAHTRAMTYLRTRKSVEVQRLPEYISDARGAAVGAAEDEASLLGRFPVRERELLETSHVSDECSGPMPREKLVAEQEVVLLRAAVRVEPTAAPTPRACEEVDVEGADGAVDRDDEETSVSTPERLRSPRGGGGGDDNDEALAPDTVSYALTSLDITLRPEHWHLFAGDLSPLFTAMRVDVAACLGLSARAVEVAERRDTTADGATWATTPSNTSDPQNETPTAGDCGGSGRPPASASQERWRTADAPSPYPAGSDGFTEGDEEGAEGRDCVVHLLVEHDGVRADDELQSLIAAYDFPCLTQLCQEYAEEGGCEQQQPLQPPEEAAEATIDGDISMDAPEELRHDTMLFAEESQASVAPSLPHRSSVAAEADVTGPGHTVGVVEPVNGSGDLALATDKSELRMSTLLRATTPAREAAAEVELVDVAPTPLAVERAAVLTEEDPSPREPEPEPEWYLEYLAMKQRAKEALAQDGAAAALPYEAHLEAMEKPPAVDAQRNEDDATSPAVAAAVGSGDMASPSLADGDVLGEAQLRDMCGCDAVSVTHHDRVFDGDEWPVVMASSREYLKQQFILDLAQGLECDPRCVRNVFFIRGGCEVIFDVAHRADVSKESVDHFVAQYPFPLVMELYECRGHLAEAQEETEEENDVEADDAGEAEVKVDETTSTITTHAATQMNEVFDRTAEPSFFAADEEPSRRPTVTSPILHGGDDVDESIAVDVIDEGQRGREACMRGADGEDVDNVVVAAPAVDDRAFMSPSPPLDRRDSSEEEDGAADMQALEGSVPRALSATPLCHDAEEEPAVRGAGDDKDDVDFEELAAESAADEHCVAHTELTQDYEELAYTIAPQPPRQAEEPAAQPEHLRTEEVRLPTTRTSATCRPITPDPVYTHVKGFPDFTCTRLSLVPCRELADLCQIPEDRVPALSHHHVWLAGSEWGLVLDSCPLFLRDQFTSETCELLGRPARCVRNVLLRASDDALRIDFDLVHDGELGYEELDGRLRAHVFHLLLELYRSRLHVSKLNLDEGLEANLPLYALEAVSANARDTPSVSLSRQTDSEAESVGAVHEASTRASAEVLRPHPPPARQLPRPSSTHTNYERLSLASSPVGSSVTPSAVPVPVARAASASAVAAAAGPVCLSPVVGVEDKEGVNGCAASSVSACSGYDYAHEVHRSPLASLLQPPATSRRLVASGEASRTHHASGGVPAQPSAMGPTTLARAESRPISGRSTASIHTILSSSTGSRPPVRHGPVVRCVSASAEGAVPSTSTSSSHAPTSPRNNVLASAVQEPAAETPTAPASADAAFLEWMGESGGPLACAGLAEQPLRSSDPLSASQLTSRVSNVDSSRLLLDPADIRRPSNPVYQQLNSSRASSMARARRASRHSSVGNATTHTVGGGALFPNLGSNRFSRSRRSSAEVEEVPGYSLQPGPAFSHTN